MKMKKMVLLLIVGLISLAGCGQISETIGKLQGELKKDIAYAEQDMAQDKDEISIEETYETIPTEAKVEAPSMEVELYFANKSGDKLVKTTKKIEKKEGMARATMQTLLQGTNEGDLMSAIPTGTKLLDINIKEGLCIVDFSEEFLEAGKGAINEKLAVQAVVQTLCQFDTVEKVEFRVNGKRIERLNQSEVAAEVFADKSILQ